MGLLLCLIIRVSWASVWRTGGGTVGDSGLLTVQEGALGKFVLDIVGMA